MQYLDQTGYAFREFYARNPGFAPKPTSWRKRLVVYTLLLLLGAGGLAAGAYLSSGQMNPAQLLELVRIRTPS